MSERPRSAFWDGAATVEHRSSVGVLCGLVQGGVAVFRGIPYAEAPVGALRFAAPVHRGPLDEPFDATRWGATPQRLVLDPDTAIPERVVPGYDILNLNVFAPRQSLNAAAALPVLVYIHGGSYQSGSSSGAWTDGRRFAAAGVVVVTISYRLSVDGFTAMAGAPENRGVLDWIAALEWVRDHIASFGGDPARVTVAGQSAGGGAVLALMATERAAGLFARAWSLSGILEQVEPVRAGEQAAAIAADLGVEPTAEGFARRTDEEAQRAHAARTGELYFPVTGGELFPDGIAAGLEEHGRDTPLVLGATADEFVDAADEPQLDPERAVGMLHALAGVPLPAAAAAVAELAPRRGLGIGRLQAEATFRAALVRAVQHRSGAAATWAYDLRRRSPVTGLAQHCDDIPLFFGLTDEPTSIARIGDVTEEDALSLHDAAVAFVRGGALDWSPRRGVLAAATGVRIIGPAQFEDDFATAALLTGRFD